MVIKVQRNPSTGKVLYNPSTGKVLVYNPAGADCGDCDSGQTPKIITVTFHDVVLASVTCNNLCTPVSGKFVLYPSGLTVDCEQISDCEWRGGATDLIVTYHGYPEEDCVGEPSIIETYGPCVIIKKQEASLVNIYAKTCGAPDFCAIGGYSLVDGQNVSSEDCLTVNNQQWTNAVPDICSSPWKSGKVTIVEQW